MVQLLKKPQVTILTKDGECEIHILLDLNINLNMEGPNDIKVTHTISQKEKEKDEDDMRSFIMPEFKMEKVKFGERV